MYVCVLLPPTVDTATLIWTLVDPASAAHNCTVPSHSENNAVGGMLTVAGSTT